jgi:hypothetical protein
MAQYRVLAGIDYPPNKRAEIGEIVTDLPGSAIKSLLEIGAIESLDGKKAEPVIEATPAPVEETPAPVVEETTTTEEAGE